MTTSGFEDVSSCITQQSVSADLVQKVVFDVLSVCFCTLLRRLNSVGAGKDESAADVCGLSAYFLFSLVDDGIKSPCKFRGNGGGL